MALPSPRLQHWRGDLVGGVTTALVILPLELAYGVMAVIPLGGGAASAGLLLGLYAAVVGGTAAALAGNRAVLMSGMRPGLALILAPLALHLSASPPLPTDASGLSGIIPVLLLGVFVAGLIQVGFALLRVGRVIRYLPYPVLAGLMNGIALLTLFAAVPPVLGMGTTLLHWQDAGRALEQVQPAAIAIAALTLTATCLAPRLPGRVPPLFAGLLTGTLAYHVLGTWGGVPAGSTFQAIDAALPGASHLEALGALAEAGQFIPLLGLVMPYAFAIAVVSSLETMLAAAALDDLDGARTNGDRQLRAQGWANLASGLVGGGPVAGATSRSVAAYRAGARSSLAALAYTTTVVLVVALAGDSVALLPTAVIGAILMYIAWNTVDSWSRQLLGQVLGRRALNVAARRQLASNLSVTVLVAGLAVALGLMPAVFVGAGAAMLLFVRNHVRPVVRNTWTGVTRRSLRVLSPERTAWLRKHGDAIKLLELDGSLFFGTAEQLWDEVEQRCAASRVVILDFRRVAEVDASAARMLQRLARSLAAQCRWLVFAGVDTRGDMGRIMASLGLAAEVPRERWLHDADAALEWAEDHLLAETDAGDDAGRVDLADSLIAQGLDGHEIATLRACVHEQRFAEGEGVFATGDAGDRMYILQEGRVTIRIPLDGAGRWRRLVSFAPGLIFGEMAMLEGKPRSADAVADTPVVVLWLDREAFDALTREHPHLVRKLLYNLSLHIADRLRQATLELSAEGR